MSGGDKAKLTRRALLGGTAALCAERWRSPSSNRRHRAASSSPPIRGPPIVVFVHGNGDSSALWINNIWRFEANGYKRNQLFAIDFAYPNARREDAKPELFRSSAEEQMKELAAYVQQALKAAGRRKVALVGSSRGGNAIRSFLKDGGGAQFVSHAVLCGTPNKGVVNLRQPAGRQRVQRRLHLPQGAQRRARRSHPRRRA